MARYTDHSATAFPDPIVALNSMVGVGHEQEGTRHFGGGIRVGEALREDLMDLMAVMHAGSYPPFQKPSLPLFPHWTHYAKIGGICLRRAIGPLKVYLEISKNVYLHFNFHVIFIPP